MSFTFVEKVRENVLATFRVPNELMKKFNRDTQVSRRLCVGEYCVLPDGSIVQDYDSYDSESGQIWFVHCTRRRCSRTITQLKFSCVDPNGNTETICMSFHRDGHLQHYTDNHTSFNVVDHGATINITYNTDDADIFVKMHNCMRPDRYVAQQHHVRAMNISQWCKEPIEGVSEITRALALDIISTGHLNNLPSQFLGNGVPYYLYCNVIGGDVVEINDEHAMKQYYSASAELLSIELWNNAPTRACKPRNLDRGTGDEFVIFERGDDGKPTRRVYINGNRTHYVKNGDDDTCQITRMLNGALVDELTIKNGEVICQRIDGVVRFTYEKSVDGWGVMFTTIKRFNAGGMLDGWCLGDVLSGYSGDRDNYRYYENGVLYKECINPNSAGRVLRTYTANGTVEMMTDDFGLMAEIRADFMDRWWCSPALQKWLY